MLNLKRSIIEKIQYNGKNYLLKRDDLIHPEFSGNKARKFYYYFKADLSNYKTLVSFGGNQSNAMYSLSALAKLKNMKLKYYTRPIPKFLKENPVGNYKLALENGMEIIEYPNFYSPKIVEKLKAIINKDEYLIIQGGREPNAEMGVKILAEEINNYAKDKNINQLSVFLPSGTGATAVYLQKHLKFPVYTTPCVGDKEYLTQQFSELVSDKNLHPKILYLNKKYAFGKPYKEFIETWQNVCSETKKPFDLLYDPLGWLIVDKFYEELPHPIIYIQCGGLTGNSTMINRYKRKNWI